MGESRFSLAVSSLSFVISLAAQRGLPFLALPIVARIISQTEYGFATMSIVIASVLGVTMNLGLSSAIPRLLHSNIGSSGSTWVALLVIQIAFSGMLSIVAIAALTTYGGAIGDDFQRYALPTVLLAFVSSVQQSFQGIAVARSTGGRLMLATLVQLSVGLWMATVLTVELTGVGYVYALSIGGLVAVLVMLPMKYPKQLWDRKGIRSGFRLSWPFIGQGLSTWLLSLFDRVVIGVLLGASLVGSYQAAYMAGSILGMVLEGVQATWASRFYRSTRKDKLVLIERLIAPSLVLATGMVIAIVAVSPGLLPWIIPDYEIRYDVMGLIALAALPRAVYFVAVVKLLDAGRSITIMTSTMVSGGLTVVAVVGIVPVLGVVGAAIVSLAAFLVQALIVSRSAFGWSTKELIVRVILPPCALLPFALLAWWLASANLVLAVVIAVLALAGCVVSAIWFFKEVLSLVRVTD